MRATAGARQWVGLAVLALPCLLVSLDAEVLNMAAPQLSADLRPTAVQLLWIMDSYVFVVAGFLIAMGVLGDRIGRRRLLLAGAVAFALSSLLAAFATSPELLIAARVLMGLAGASLMPSTLALIRAMFADARQRGIALGVWSASFSLGGLAAPLIGGVMLEHFWWGSVFLLAVPATLLLVVLGPALLPEARDPSARGFDLAGAVLSLVAVLIFVYGIKRLAAEGRPAVPLLTLVIAGAVLTLFLRRQRRIAQPLLDLSMFADRRVRVGLIANALSFFVLYGTQLAIVQYLQIVLDLSPLRAGLWALPSVGAFLLASLLGPMLVRWFPAGRVIAVGAVIMAAGHGLMALAPYGGGLPILVAGMVIGGFGLAPVYTLTTDLVVSSVRSSRAGMGAAVTETGAELGGAIGIAVLGSVVVAAYRSGMSGVPGLPADGTLMDAAAAADRLPGSMGTALLQQADNAYGMAFAVVSLVAAGLVAVAAVLAFRVLWPTPPGAAAPASEPSDMVVPTQPSEHSADGGERATMSAVDR
ncbi:MFS transporter [Actinoplanes sp. TRM 88003]|uniref:MFS transporter n=1 Tax=Paractinoplanes aksuensis TaxID=2939490 RepID=A0ABT1DG93_9ACTN|nr:MFS transporter [Actinoplanes aksuensis]MCO8269858.1 MFS transporter [Actinoplanes aksuensis]